MRVIPRLDPTIQAYVMGSYKADDLRGEIIGQALIFERELNAWIDRLEEMERVEREEVI